MVDEEEERRGLLKLRVLLCCCCRCYFEADEGKEESGVWEGKVAVVVLQVKTEPIRRGCGQWK